MRRKKNKSNTRSAFTLIELMITVAIIGVLAAIATASFMSYRQKALIAACIATAHSIQASLTTYATGTSDGSFPRASQLSTWSNLTGLCNPNGSTLRTSAVDSGFEDWISYVPVDLNTDNKIDEYYLVLRVNGINHTVSGSQIEISPSGIIRQTY